MEASNGNDQKVTNAVIGGKLSEIEKTLTRIECKVDQQAVKIDGLNIWKAGQEERNSATEKDINSLHASLTKLTDRFNGWNFGNSAASAIAGLLALFWK